MVCIYNASVSFNIFWTLSCSSKVDSTKFFCASIRLYKLIKYDGHLDVIIITLVVGVITLGIVQICNRIWNLAKNAIEMYILKSIWMPLEYHPFKEHFYWFIISHRGKLSFPKRNASRNIWKMILGLSVPAKINKS